MNELGMHDHAKMTLGQLHAEWLELYAEGNLSRKSVLDSGGTWRKHLEDYADTPLHEIDTVGIERMVAWMRRDGVGPAAITKTLTMLSSMFTRAVHWGYVQRNPCIGVKRPRGSKRSVRALSIAEVERIRSSMGE